MTNLRVIRSGPRENAGDYSLEPISYRRSPIRDFDNNIISKLLSSAVIHALDALLTALLSPVIMWQWLSKHDRFMIILRVTIEVALELIMLIVFAGVSILTAAALVFDDAYDDTTYSTKSKREPNSSGENDGKIRE